MGLNIKNPEVERLISETAKARGISKTEAVRQGILALQRTPQKVTSIQSRKAARIAKLLTEEIWPLIPKEQLGKAPSKAERESMLGLT